MTESKDRVHILKRSHLQAAGILLLIFLAVLLLWFNKTNSTQAFGALVAQVRFYGEYRIGDSQWQKIEEGQHISATKGDVTLRGNFHMLTPDGEYVGVYRGELPVALYSNHISLTIYEGENEPHALDIENPLYGSSACSKYWTAYMLSSGVDEVIEILIHNPHRFGNENAIDEMLSNMALWAGIDFERDVMDRGQYQRNTGLFFVIVSLVLLGSALFSALLHVPNTRIIWLLGAAILSAGIYLAYSAPGVSFWSETMAVNTSVLGFSMMFYMLFVSGSITYFLKGTRRLGCIATIVSGVSIGIYFIMPVLTDVYFYDTWLPWVITQSTANVVLLFCLIKEYLASGRKERWGHIGMMLLMLAFEADAAATAAGLWEGGAISKYVFFVLFIAALFVVLRLIPKSINAAVHARELELQSSRLEAEKNMMEAELKESRISIMLSQIQPHFLYNVLNSIYHLYRKEPETAQEAVSSFAEYLRCNMLSIEKQGFIPFSEEYKHIQTYLALEQIRFRGKLDVVYDVEITNFSLPPLTVEPLVENAVKHGITKKRSGGVVSISTRKTNGGYTVTVSDTGIGFDPDNYMKDGKPHIGIHNVKERLQRMVGGELTITSTPEGTVAVVTIPEKEERDENHCGR